MVGYIHDIHDYGGGTLLEVAYTHDLETGEPQSSYTHEMLIFNDKAVPEINIDEGYITIAPPVYLEMEKPDTA